MSNFQNMEQWLEYQSTEDDSTTLDKSQLEMVLSGNANVVIFLYKKSCPYCIEFDNTIYRPMSKWLHSSNKYTKSKFEKVFLLKFDGSENREWLDQNTHLFPSKQRIPTFPHLLFLCPSLKFYVEWPKNIPRSNYTILQWMANVFKQSEFNPIPFSPPVSNHPDCEFVIFYKEEWISPRLMLDPFLPITDTTQLNQMVCHLCMKWSEKVGKNANYQKILEPEKSTCIYLPKTKTWLFYRDVHMYLLRRIFTNEKEWIEKWNQISTTDNQLVGSDCSLNLSKFQGIAGVRNMDTKALAQCVFQAHQKGIIPQSEWYRYAKLGSLINSWGGREILIHEISKDLPKF